MLQYQSHIYSQYWNIIYGFTKLRFSVTTPTCSCPIIRLRFDVRDGHWKRLCGPRIHLVWLNLRLSLFSQPEN